MTMKTKTLALVGLLVMGLVAAAPTASAASAAADDQDRCIGLYEEDAQGNKKCTGVWQSTLCSLLANVLCDVGA